MTKKNKTVRDACTSWLKTCERNDLETATMKAYRSHAHVHIEPRIGHLLLTDLTRSDVRDFMNDLLDEGVSQAQTRKIMVSLRAALSEAEEREWIDHNVALSVKMRRQRKRVEDDKVIPTKEQIRLILDNAPTTHAVMFRTMIFTGLRISEARGLPWKHVDLDRKLIEVRQKADEQCKIGPPKSRAGHRTIPLAPNVVEALEAWKSEVPSGDDDLVFPNASGNPQNYANIYNRIYVPMMRDLELVDGDGKCLFTIHSLRHAAASLFIEQGWNPKKIQTLLGHANITMTMDCYGHLFEDPEKDVAMFEKLEQDFRAA
ncbi:tyrosine-type recombinase/integrase [Anianabacter salinae]|uniref:tyrosine-type recombinase/integrase n=1 Tax=Anianabacter salinae TaxID=2851023 RepID=UPI00225DE8F8|nr:site-specific integrase [Anianabacter salinae]MBV0912503.1 site-specific integrase [Anianabacter salinae]